MESNALEKSTNMGVALRFLHTLSLWFDELLESVMLWIDFSESLSNFLDFRFDTVEKQSIIKLSTYSSNIYASVFPSDFEDTFLGERGDAAFSPFLYHI